jgi:hypothetical protein
LTAAQEIVEGCERGCRFEHLEPNSLIYFILQSQFL